MKMLQKLVTAIIPIVAVLLLASQADAQRRGRAPDVWKFLSEKYDKNDDGKLSKSEYGRSEETFDRLDTNKDGNLSSADWASGGKSARRGQRGNQRGGSKAAPKIGDKAPDFTLTHVLDKTKKAKISSFSGSKPVALIFGSCT